MSRRVLVGVVFVIALVGLMPVTVVGQTGQRTSWGDPDLQGSYTFSTTTPLLRPEALGDKEFFTDEEIAAQEQATIERNLEALNAPAERAVAGGNVGAYNNHWLEPGTRPTNRTSLIVDPPNGQLPARTPEGERLDATHRAAFTTDGPFDSWENLELNDRCLFWSAGPPMLPTFYNNNVMVIQTPEYVALYYEMIHDTRIIPLDGRPHLATEVRQWIGDARGRWEGDTLVVETRNIQRTEANAGTGVLPGTPGGDPFLIRAANGRTDDTITVTERFTRLDADTLGYEFTVDDPTRWTQSISGEFPLVALQPHQGLYEYACHEGNYTIPNILSGARAEERAKD
jgi:hypothetical protein